MYCSHIVQVEFEFEFEFAIKRAFTFHPFLRLCLIKFSLLGDIVRQALFVDTVNALRISMNQEFVLFQDLS